MSTATLTIHLEFDEEPSENLLAGIANSSIRYAVESDWMPGGRNLAGYEGPLVKSVVIAHNGIEIREA